MKSEPKWPEKILSIRDDDYDKGYYRGRNIAIDVCITAFNEWLKEQKLVVLSLTPTPEENRVCCSGYPNCIHHSTITPEVREWDENNDGKCYVCGKMTDSYAGDPSVWAIYLAHIDGSQKHRHYHMKCLYPIILATKTEGQ